MLNVEARNLRIVDADDALLFAQAPRLSASISSSPPVSCGQPPNTTARIVRLGIKARYPAIEDPADVDTQHTATMVRDVVSPCAAQGVHGTEQG
jgi:hypothetical protein